MYLLMCFENQQETVSDGENLKKLTKRLQKLNIWKTVSNFFKVNFHISEFYIGILHYLFIVL